MFPSVFPSILHSIYSIHQYNSSEVTPRVDNNSDDVDNDSDAEDTSSSETDSIADDDKLSLE